MANAAFAHSLEEPAILAVHDFPVAHVVVSRTVQNADATRAHGWVMYAYQASVGVL